jgi:hypothetical protein
LRGPDPDSVWHRRTANTQHRHQGLSSCRSLVRRSRHRCRGKGKWDLAPGFCKLVLVHFVFCLRCLGGPLRQQLPNTNTASSEYEEKERQHTARNHFLGFGVHFRFGEALLCHIVFFVVLASASAGLGLGFGVYGRGRLKPCELSSTAMNVSTITPGSPWRI